MQLEWWTFLAITLALEVTPGPAVLFILFQSSRGMSYVLAAVAGLLSANIVWISLVATGLGLLLVNAGYWFTGLRYVGALYLVYLGYRIYRYGMPKPIAKTDALAKASTVSYFHAYRQGMLTSFSNPKALLFFLALFPQFIRIDHYYQDIVTLGVTKMIMLALVMSSYGLVGKSLFNRLARSDYAVWVFRGLGIMIIVMSYGVAFG